MRAIRFDPAEQHGAREAPASPRRPAIRQPSPDRRNHTARERLLHGVRAEFDELRGLKLTLAQAQRLFGLREDVCQRVLNTLVRDGFLRVGPRNLYTRKNLLRT
jgi:hypothetical protein